MQADAEHDGGVLRLIPIGFRHRLLELDGGAERIHGAGELGQRAVARQLDQPAAMAGQIGSSRSVCDGPSAGPACRSHPGPSAASSPRHLPQGWPPVAVQPARRSKASPMIVRIVGGLVRLGNEPGTGRFRRSWLVL